MPKKPAKNYRVESKTLFGKYRTKRRFTKAEADRVVKINTEAQRRVKGGWNKVGGGRAFVPKNTFRTVKAEPPKKKNDNWRLNFI